MKSKTRLTKRGVDGPRPLKRPDGRGKPRRDDCEILNGILWVMRTGAEWKDMPERYPPYQTCHRRFQEWVRPGTFEIILRTLVKDVKERGVLDLTECFIDGTIVIAKKGAKGWLGRPANEFAAALRLRLQGEIV